MKMATRRSPTVDDARVDCGYADTTPVVLPLSRVPVWMQWMLAAQAVPVDVRRYDVMRPAVSR